MSPEVVRHGRDDVHVEFAVKPLLYDFHVEQSEESAAETESERERTFRLERERCVVELQFFERSAQILVLVGFDRIDTREDHRFHVLESGNRLLARCCDGGNRVADLHVARILDAGADVAHVAGADFVARRKFEFEYSDLVGIVFAAGVEELHHLALADSAVEDAEIRDYSAERIEYRVENQRLQRCVLVAFRSGNTAYYRFEYLFHSRTRFARCAENVVVFAAEQIDDLVFHLIDHSRIHVDFVQNRNDFQIVAQCKIEIRYGLCLNALRGIDHEQCPFARGYRPRNLVGEIDVSRSVDKVEYVLLAVLGGIFHLDGMALYGNALFAFQIHIVEYLRLHLTLVERVCHFEQTVGERRFAVVYVRYDTEVPNVFHDAAKIIKKMQIRMIRLVVLCRQR